MEVFRLAREKFSRILSGKGAALKGARWNSVGVDLIYTAGNRSLAMAEVAVHFTLATIPADYVMVTIHIPDDISVTNLRPSDLPVDWNVFPHTPGTQWIGDQFVNENKSCVLKVPSSVTMGDHNFLINPKHREFRRIKIIKTEKFPFDSRIFK